MPKQITRRSGLTLFELVVVLSILAAIATSAMVSTGRILSRRRMEITQQTLDAFTGSLLGNYGEVKSVSSVSAASSASMMDGFVADLGRVPIAIGTDPKLQLQELWSNPLNVSPYGRKIAPGDPEVALNCGWRGPYIDLPVNADHLTDGWGMEMTVLTVDESGEAVVAADGDPIFGLTSLGSDGEVGVTTTELPLAEDLTVWLGNQVSSPLHSDITVTVYQADGSGGQAVPTGAGSLMVRLYLPDPTTGNLTHMQSPLLSGPFSTAPSFVFSDVPIGPKVIRAYWQDSESNNLSSPVTQIDIRRGGNTMWSLVLPQGSM